MLTPVGEESAAGSEDFVGGLGIAAKIGEPFRADLVLPGVLECRTTWFVFTPPFSRPRLPFGVGVHPFL